MVKILHFRTSWDTFSFRSEANRNIAVTTATCYCYRTSYQGNQQEAEIKKECWSQEACTSIPLWEHLKKTFCHPWQNTHFASWHRTHTLTEETDVASNYVQCLLISLFYSVLRRFFKTLVCDPCLISCPCESRPVFEKHQYEGMRLGMNFWVALLYSGNVR